MGSLWYPGGELPVELSPEDYTEQQRELDEIGPVMRLEGNERHRYGVAVPDLTLPGMCKVIRYADYGHAEAAAYSAPWLEIAWSHSGLCGRDLVVPMVWQYECQGPWHFAATGWEVPM